MWKPEERLDDFIVRPAADVTAEPPSEVLLRPTSEVEVLTPLSTEPDQGPSLTSAHLWFRRLVLAGSGAIVFIGSILISAILVGISEPSGPDVATLGHFEDNATQSEDLFHTEDYFPPDVSPVTGDVYVVLSKIKPTLPRKPRVRTVVYHKPKRQIVPPPHRIAEAKFIPTTLVIYAENGVINSRIEPWVQ